MFLVHCCYILLFFFFFNAFSKAKNQLEEGATYRE